MGGNGSSSCLTFLFVNFRRIKNEIDPRLDLKLGHRGSPEYILQTILSYALTTLSSPSFLFQSIRHDLREICLLFLLTLATIGSLYTRYVSPVISLPSSELKFLIKLKSSINNNTSKSNSSITYNNEGASM